MVCVSVCAPRYIQTFKPKNSTLSVAVEPGSLYLILAYRNSVYRSYSSMVGRVTLKNSKYIK